MTTTITGAEALSGSSAQAAQFAAKRLNDHKLSEQGRAERERQRVAHLVLGEHRPRPAGVGRGRSKRKVPIVLAPGIEESVAMRERWSHKQGTPETHEHAARTREGSLRRLYLTGAIDAEQLASAVRIAEVVEQIGADVAVRTASLEARVDSTRNGDGGFHEKLGRVRREMAYTRWRNEVAGPIALLLDIIVGDDGVTIAAKRYRMHNRKAKQLLLDALDLWPRILGEVSREVDPATLVAAHAGILG